MIQTTNSSQRGALSMIVSAMSYRLLMRRCLATVMMTVLIGACATTSPERQSGAVASTTPKIKDSQENARQKVDPGPRKVRPVAQAVQGSIPSYEEGKKALMAGNFPEAVRIYRAVAIQSPGSKDAERARIELAFAYYRLGDSAPAIAVVERFLRV